MIVFLLFTGSIVTLTLSYVVKINHDMDKLDRLAKDLNKYKNEIKTKGRCL